jgi:serine phosphatase RsbU (regulator of sigma subunit)/HAMP domain-containing protein
MSRKPITPRPTRIRPAGPFLRLFQRLRAPLWVKLAAGPIAITVLMLLIGLSIAAAFSSIQRVGEQLVQDARLIEQATRLQITVRGAVNFSREVIQDPRDKNVAGYFQQRKLVLDGLTAVRAENVTLSPDETTSLRAIERALAEADRMTGLVQDDRLDGARSLWDQRVHDLADTAVIEADRFRRAREAAAEQNIGSALEAIWASALTTGLLILLALVTVLAFGWLNTGLVARPIRLVALAMQQVAAGDLDVTVALAQRDELGLLEQSFNQMTGALRILLKRRAPTTGPLPRPNLGALPPARAEDSALLRTARDAAVETSRLGAELEEAYRIQAALLPPPDQTLHGWHVEASIVPAVELGGDFYDLLNLPGGRLGLVIGDVSGHGAASALLGAWTQGMIAAVTANEHDPGRVLAQINTALRTRLPRRMMVTLAYMVIDPEAGTIEFANAGHPFPHLRFAGDVPPLEGVPKGVELQPTLYGDPSSGNGSSPARTHVLDQPELVAADEGHWLWLHAPGVPLGVAARPHYPTVRLPLEAVEAVCLYSDGVIEARDPAGEMFGFAGLHAACQALPPLDPEHPTAAAAAGVVQRVVTFAAGTPVEDDMTVLLVRRLPAATAALSATTDADVRYTRLPEGPSGADAVQPVLES